VTIEDCEVLCTMICQKQCAENPSGWEKNEMV
jgi:hypothetical protein